MPLVPRAQLTPISHLVGEDEEETQGLHQLVDDALSFLSGFEWCGRVTRAHFGIGVAGVAAVVLVGFEPREVGVPDELWVIVGDIPPAYIVTDNASDPESALRAYLEEMAAWVDAVRRGDSVGDLIPVDGAPTASNAAALDKRLNLLKSFFLEA